MYVHPDKNPDDKERADIAFEGEKPFFQCLFISNRLAESIFAPVKAVNRAYKMLDDEKERKQCLEVVEEATERVNKTCEEKRKKLRREAVAAAALAAEKEKSSKSSRFAKPEEKPVSMAIEEDDPDKVSCSIEFTLLDCSVKQGIFAVVVVSACYLCDDLQVVCGY